MKQKNRFQRKIFSVVLTLAMAVGLMPQLAMPAYAATDTYTNLIPTGQEEGDAQRGDHLDARTLAGDIGAGHGDQAALACAAGADATRTAGRHRHRRAGA